MNGGQEKECGQCVQGGRDRQRVQDGRQRGRCRYVFPGQQGGGITRRDTDSKACLRVSTHTVESHSLEESSKRKEVTDFLQ